MSKVKDGGPAFPLTRIKNANDEVAQWEEPGMSLRDWFAGQALAGVLPAWCADGASLPEPELAYLSLRVPLSMPTA